MIDSSKLQDFSVRAAEQWRDLVNFAMDTPEDKLPQLVEKLASAWKDAPSPESKASLLRKFKAVRSLALNGSSREDICKMGQSKTLSAHAITKRNGHEPVRQIKYNLPATLAEAIQWSDKSSPDAEEALFTRFHRLGITTSAQAFEFILSTYADMDDEEILNRRGAFTEKDAPKRRRK